MTYESKKNMNQKAMYRVFKEQNTSMLADHETYAKYLQSVST